MLGRTIRDFRVAAGFNQEELAARAQISRSYVSRLESGDIAKPSADFLIRIARAVGVHPDQLFAAADYRVSGSTSPKDERERAIQWIADSTAAWPAEEILLWGRIMVANRNVLVETGVPVGTSQSTRPPAPADCPAI